MLEWYLQAANEGRANYFGIEEGICRTSLTLRLKSAVGGGSRCSVLGIGGFLGDKPVAGLICLNETGQPFVAKPPELVGATFDGAAPADRCQALEDFLFRYEGSSVSVGVR